MIKNIRTDLEEVRGKKLHKFENLDPLIRRCIREYRSLFPKLGISKRGSKIVYHFNVPGVNPISIEKQHGSRDSIPRYYAKLIIAGIDDVVIYIEARESMAETDENLMTIDWR
jgi:hypothetical protein